jgi:hypothetical protein
MKFIVRRTSGHGDDESPCKGAIKGTYVMVDERVVDDPSKLRGSTKDDWYAAGRNHRVEKGHIKRDYDDEAWFIEVKSLHDLLKLSSKHGEIIVSRYFMNHDLWSLEIYDDYRE